MATQISHHGHDGHQVAALLQTDEHRGLSSEQVRERMARFGPNVFVLHHDSGIIRRIARQFHHPLIYVLMVAGAVTAAVQEYVDSSVIFGVVVINAVVGFIQESKAQAALQSLRALVHTEATVVRDGRDERIPSEQLVPGDLVRCQAGDKVPADIRLLRHSALHIDESALTGESVPVAKDDVTLPEATLVADRRNMAYSATLVTAGSGTGIVVATGDDTQIGQIHRLVATAEVLATPLTAKLAWFSKVLTIGIVVLAGMTFAIGVLRHHDVVEMFTAAVALAVGAIPEGLPAAVTITLAIGVARMAQLKAVIRRLPAVETLGSTTVICADKTGTLTQNQMTVRHIWTPDDDISVTGLGYTPEGLLLSGTGESVVVADNAALHWSLLAGAVCSAATVTHDGQRWQVTGDPTEIAMVVVAAKAGIIDTHGRINGEDDFPRIAMIPFSSQRQYMATLHQTGPDAQVVFVKGSVERILHMCCAAMGADGSLQPIDDHLVLHTVDELAAQGLRVLATATSNKINKADFDAESFDNALLLTGLQAMLDPPREAAAAAVRACHSAGIAVKMITGDHAGTAAAIAESIGLLDSAKQHHRMVVTGSELDQLSPEELSDALENAAVFARVAPEQKLQFVQVLQTHGHIVAMTGDGVNDAPALRQANIGVAMGYGGTEVAKDAADMVLLDDDFATIEVAVEEGRGVFDNLTKFITWTLPTNIGEGLVIMAAIAAGVALPILPTQILWINMTTAVALGLMLAFEPKESSIMTRPPRDPAQPLLTRALMWQIFLVSSLLVITAWWVYHSEMESGATLAQARTAAVNAFVVVEIFYLFSCRSLTRSVWRVGIFTNRWLIVGVIGQIIAQLGLTYIPAMNAVFKTAPIDAGMWLRIVAAAAAVSVVVGMQKWCQARFTRPAE